MTDTNSYRKWFYRCALTLLGLLSTYVVLQPEYNFAHWIPHNLLRTIGVPYSAVLVAESNADKLLHPLLAFIFTILLHRSRLALLNDSIYSPMQALCVVIVAAELAQWYIGRGFEASDVLLGGMGTYLGILYLQRKETK